MEEQAAESLDGSSIKPVSSLRSHFEQMASLKPRPPPPPGPKPITPQPTGNGISKGPRNIARPISVQPEAEEVGFGDALRAARGREQDIVEPGLRPPRTIPANMSPSPTRSPRPRPLSKIPPAVTIQPPQSPPKTNTLNLVLPGTPSYLQTESPMTASPGVSSPRSIRIPTQPNTPLLESGRSPKMYPSQPPSPPPPRRSGEFRREAAHEVREAPSKPKPPPVNRAEKPKISSRPLSMSFRREATTLQQPGPLSAVDKTSPFSTPPSSGSSPEHEFPEPVPLRSRNVFEQRVETFPTAHKSFDPPPLHPSVVNRRKDQEINGLNRGLISPQTTGDQRPTLPSRPQAVPDPMKARGLRDMMPPPARPSLDRTRPPTIKTNSIPEGGHATPPKRVFSQPIDKPSPQFQTQRSHGRSMTVSSPRTPIEFRNPAVHIEPRHSMDTSSLAPSTKEPTYSGPGEYPDISRINRRLPEQAKLAHQIPTKYDTRILDICGEYVCTTGHFTRVWSLVDGAPLASIVHAEGIKMMSIAFKPMPSVEDEGKRLWLGSNTGEISEVDVDSQSIVITKANVHTRRDIIKIYRHVNEMWTLDDGGSLNLWAPNSEGTPTLEGNPRQSFRVPKGHTFSTVIGDELWYATGKELRVYVASRDTQQWLALQCTQKQENSGDITSGAILEPQSDKVYIGHTDGKVSIYSRRDYSCLGVVNVSVYKITSLAGAGGYLWTGFSTGQVYIYDTTNPNWVVQKEWQAHHDPVVKMIADPGSCWTLERSNVVSLGQDNMIRVWDGLLQDDWIENQMQSQEPEYATFTPIKALVMTWNAGATKPTTLRNKPDDDAFFGNLLGSSGVPDLLIFGFQELVDLEDKKTMTKTFFKSKKKDPTSEHEHMSRAYREWRAFITASMDNFIPGEIYQLLHTASLVGLFTCIFVRAPLHGRIKCLSAVEVKRGMGGLHGNKGALIVRFNLDDTSMCFINCHLAAGQTQTKDRNADIAAILESSLLPPVASPPAAEKDNKVLHNYIGGGDGSMVMDHEICILNGDLNYRIDTMGRETVVRDVKSHNLGKLLDRDQLIASKRKHPWFKLRAFSESPITFAPTYKYDVGTDNYDSSEKKRAPAWCDRVLFRGGQKIQELDYRRHEVRVSDHRPVTAKFEILTKKVHINKRAMKLAECLKQQADRKQRLTREARLYYLTTYLGFTAAYAKPIIAARERLEAENLIGMEKDREQGRKRNEYQQQMAR
ncbi:related to phosphatidylinositol phosphate phosphatase [Rhynchosporium graminicola]|uniref:Related to phosphatidylinositol phosphate phosphatase n=1 Tax=Rhynchosporium graminicola TaxID=2792576 RepID=A0A1E1KRF6_9HELO|nr:related to phosphatidylinositol phosphate phosphatase [Rhynchosporium commune]